MKVRILFILFVLGFITVIFWKENEPEQHVSLNRNKNQVEMKRQEEKQALIAEVKAEKKILDHYRQNLKFPPYSKPVDAENKQMIFPHYFEAIKKTEADVSYFLSVARSTAFEGEEFPITFQMVCQQRCPDLKELRGVIKDGDIIVKTMDFNVVAQTTNSITYQIFFPDLELKSQWKQEFLVETIFLLGDDPSPRSMSLLLNYVKKIAEVENVSEAFVQKEHLLIPVEVRVTKRGFYKVLATLYSQKTNKPLLSLSEKNEIDRQGEVILKAHITALQQAGDAGPYLLKNIWVERIPDDFDEPRGYGKASRDYGVNGYSFDQYEQIEYSEPQEQQKLKILEGLKFD